MVPSEYSHYKHAASKAPKNKDQIEAEALLNAARLLQAVHDEWDNSPRSKLERAVKANRKIWGAFYESAFEPERQDSKDPVRMNIIQLSNFVFRRSVDILGDPQQNKLPALIQINRNIAAGLMERGQ